jgi:hypothetical protein
LYRTVPPNLRASRAREYSNCSRRLSIDAGDDDMIRHFARPLVFATMAAGVCAASLLLAFARDGSVTLDMDREMPRVLVHGFYPPERAGNETFAWTMDRAGLRLPDVDRRHAWTCELRFRGGRSDPSTLPHVTVSVDGLTVATVNATNDYNDLRIDVPPRGARDGLSLAIQSSSTFVPGPRDTRKLGIVVDRFACAPSGIALPPVRVLLHAIGSGAAFGFVLGAFGASLTPAVVVVFMVAAGQALLLSSGLAPYGAYSSNVLWLGVWIATLTAVLIAVLQLGRRTPLSAYASAVILLSAAALHLKVLGLLHPSKLTIDALFHAHRLEWVLAGKYFFTQPMPAGVSFPYAIGLYVFAAPWTSLTRDYVTLLRIIVSSAEVVAGGLLYLLVVKTGRDALAGVLAVALYHCVRLPFIIVGNANMANVFAQSAALGTLVVLALSPSGPRHIVFWLGAFALCAWAFLSHISTFAHLVVTLLALGALFWWHGDVLRRPAWRIIVGTAATALVAVVIYYGHFMDVYRTAWRASTQSHVAAAPEALPENAALAQGRQQGGAPLYARAANGFRLTAIEIGWPILLLAGIGCWHVWRRHAVDRVTLTVLALAITYGLFLLASTMSRVDAPFERYAAEFLGRVVLATYPAAVLLGGIGAAWAWRIGLAPRIMSTLLLLAAFYGGLRSWTAWFR